MGSPLPVLAYINSPALGEEGNRGPDLGPDFLIQHNIVVVTMSSRNGAAGMSFPSVLFEKI